MWNAMRCALFGPIPGNRPSSSIRSWMAPSYTPYLHPGLLRPERLGQQPQRLFLARLADHRLVDVVERFVAGVEADVLRVADRRVVFRVVRRLVGRGLAFRGFARGRR